MFEPNGQFIRVSVLNSLKKGCIDNSRTEIVVDVSGKQTSIPVISYMTSIIDPSNEELQSIPRDLLILIQIETQKILTHLRNRGRIITWNQESLTLADPSLPTSKSESLKLYTIFQPSCKNFRLSSMMLWKKQRVKSSLRYSGGRVQREN